MATRGSKASTPTGGVLPNEREEADCISAVLLEEVDSCSAADAASAHLTVGVARLSEEWDVSGALDHFLAAASQHERRALDGGGGSRRKAQSADFEWGAVWLAQVSEPL